MDRIQIGKIVNVKGLKGEVKIYPYTDYMERFEEIEYLYVGQTRYEIEKVGYHKNMPILKLKGVDTVDGAQRLRNKPVLIDPDQTRDLDADEYLIIDLIGLDVIDDSGKIGTVKDVLQQSAQDVYVVQAKGREILIPAVREFVKEVSLEGGYIRVELIEGF